MPPQNNQNPYESPQSPSQQNFQPQSASQMKKSGGKWLMPFIVVTVLLVGTLGFAAWAYMERAMYKDDTDALITEAVAIAVQKAETAKDSEFIEKEKNPLKTYAGPATFGSVTFSYPKTWSGYVDESNKGSTPLEGYFHPNVVPGLDSGQAFALRIAVVDKPYADELKRFDSDVRAGRVNVSPYRAPKVQDVLGSRITGEIERNKKSTLVMLPLRDKTVKIWTEADNFVKDFDQIVLKSLQFVK